MISNDILRDVACPPKASPICPSDQSSILLEISQAGQEYSKEHQWKDQNIPTNDASDWNCKYVIKAKRDLVDGLEDKEKGYIMI